MRKTKKTLLTVFLLSFLLKLSAQEQADTTYIFRFVPDKDMFYVSYWVNESALSLLEECVERHKSGILAGEIPVYVDGYCSSQADEAANLAMAKIRSNRVKSELIIRQQLTEKCFVTENHSGGGDYVAVRISVPLDKAEAERLAAEQERLAAERERQAEEQAKEVERLAAERERQAEERAKELERLAAERERQAEEQAKEVERLAAERERQAEERAKAVEAARNLSGDRAGGIPLSLRFNLLRWATLTPDLGLEWRINPSWGIMVNGSWTSWSWNDKDRRYALWEVMPEVRYYLGREKRGYLGAMYKVGDFNYKLSSTGKQGDLMGGGLTGGYQLKLNDALSLDFTLAIGCLHADYESSKVEDGVRVLTGKDDKNWWGPVSAGVTLVWKLGK